MLWWGKKKTEAEAFQRRQAARATAQEIQDIIAKWGFEPPKFGDPAYISMIRVLSFIRWADQCLSEQADNNERAP